MKRKRIARWLLFANSDILVVDRRFSFTRVSFQRSRPYSIVFTVAHVYCSLAFNTERHYRGVHSTLSNWFSRWLNYPSCSVYVNLRPAATALCNNIGLVLLQYPYNRHNVNYTNKHKNHRKSTASDDYISRGDLFVSISRKSCYRLRDRGGSGCGRRPQKRIYSAARRHYTRPINIHYTWRVYGMELKRIFLFVVTFCTAQIVREFTSAGDVQNIAFSLFKAYV